MFVILEIDSFSWQAEIIWFGLASNWLRILADALLACALLVLPPIVGSRKLSSLVALQLHNAHPTIKNCGDCKMPTLDFALEIAPIACTNKKKPLVMVCRGCSALVSGPSGWISGAFG